MLEFLSLLVVVFGFIEGTKGLWLILVFFEGLVNLIMIPLQFYGLDDFT